MLPPRISQDGFVPSEGFFHHLEDRESQTVLPTPEAVLLGRYRLFFWGFNQDPTRNNMVARTWRKALKRWLQKVFYQHGWLWWCSRYHWQFGGMYHLGWFFDCFNCFSNYFRALIQHLYGRLVLEWCFDLLDVHWNWCHAAGHAGKELDHDLVLPSMSAKEKLAPDCWQRKQRSHKSD